MAEILRIVSLIVFVCMIVCWQTGNAHESHKHNTPCADFVKGGKEENPTMCHSLQTFDNRQLEYSILRAIGALKLKRKTFPHVGDYWNATIVFDETLYPIPVGPSVYFFFSFAVLFCWYLNRAFHLYFAKTHKKLLLHPETAKIPVLPLYWLQQSQREMSLKREVRNTWAWLAKRYLLSPNDPLLDGIDETLTHISWDDFIIPRDTWSLVNILLKMNMLYEEVKDGSAARRRELKELEERLSAFPDAKDKDKPKDKDKDKVKILEKGHSEDHFPLIRIYEISPAKDDNLDQDWHPKPKPSRIPIRKAGGSQRRYPPSKRSTKNPLNKRKKPGKKPMTSDPDLPKRNSGDPYIVSKRSTKNPLNKRKKPWKKPKTSDPDHPKGNSGDPYIVMNTNSQGELTFEMLSPAGENVEIDRQYRLVVHHPINGHSIIVELLKDDQVVDTMEHQLDE